MFLQRTQLPCQFFQNIINTVGIFQRPLKLLVRLFLPCLELHNAGGLFEYLTAIFTPAGKDFVNTSLADDGVAFLADTRIPEKVDDVLQPAGGTVEIIFTFTVPVHPAGDHDLRKVHGQSPILIFKHQRDFAVAQGLALLGAVEDNVRHAGTPEGFRTLLPQDPPHRIADVALAGTVRSHNARDSLIKNDFRPLGKGLEAV